MGKPFELVTPTTFLSLFVPANVIGLSIFYDPIIAHESYDARSSLYQANMDAFVVKRKRDGDSAAISGADVTQLNVGFTQSLSYSLRLL